MDKEALSTRSFLNNVVKIYPRTSQFDYVNEGIPLGLQAGENKIIVVGIIGSSHFGNASLLNSIIGSPLFSDIELGSGHPINETEGTTISVYHDNAKNIIYLHLTSFLDRSLIDFQINELAKHSNSADFHQWLDRAELQSYKALLYIFLTSHIILNVSSGITIQMQDFKLFRVLQQTKQAMGHDVSKHFQSMNEKVTEIFPSFANHTDTRFLPGYCIPYLFFVYHFPKYLPSSKDSKQSGQTKSKKESAKKAKESLKTNLEQQLKVLLAINNLDRGLRSLSRARDRDGVLFVLDNRGFVCVISQQSQEKVMPSLGVLGSMLETQMPPSILPYKDAWWQSTEGPAQILCTQSTNSIYAGSKLSSFVTQTAQQTLKFRLDALPSSELWYVLSMHLGDLFLFGKSSTTSRGSSSPLLPDPRDAEKLRSMLNLNVKFSTNRCGYQLPLVKEIYYKDLPAMYTRAEHEMRMYHALRRYYSHARGSMVEYYKNLLIEEFTNTWNNGRRRCDAKSLTGHLCKYPVHITPQQRSSLEGSTSEMTVREHCSDYSSIGACNCGKTRKTRIDPFTLRDANSTFFQSRCCERATAVELPGGGIEFHSWSLLILGPASSYDPAVGMAQDGFKMRYKFLVPFLLGQRAVNPPKIQGGEEDFPSLQNSNVRNKSRGKRSDHRSRNEQANNRASNTQASGWIGYEYECPAGHRFIETLHNMQILAQENGTTSSPSTKVLNIEQAFRTEMPLHTICKSKGKQPCELALLQRIFVITPVNVDLKINPRVQVVGTFSGATKKLAFTLGQTVHVPHNAFVCLRLPFIYEYDSNPLQKQQTISSPYICWFKLV